jgi:hypothetical protein
MSQPYSWVHDNYITWHFQMSTYLRGHNAYVLIDDTVVRSTYPNHPNPTPTTDAPTTIANPDFLLWVQQD